MNDPRSSKGYKQESRWKALAFLGVALVGMLALSIGLRDLQLKPSAALPDLVVSLINTDQLGDMPGGETLLRIMRAIWLFAMFAFPFAALYIILSPRGRQQLFKAFMRIFPILLVLYLISFIAFWNRDSIDLPAFQESPAIEGVEITPTPVPSESTLPGWFLDALSLILILTVLTGVSSLGWIVWRKLRKEKTQIQLIGEEAQQALSELYSGQDVKNVIIQCYREMSRILEKERGIRRGISITPHEFQAQLEEKGLPSNAVQDLTTLFEDVRYGAETPGPDEEQRAITSLRAIVEYCKRDQ